VCGGNVDDDALFPSGRTILWRFPLSTNPPSFPSLCLSPLDGRVFRLRPSSLLPSALFPCGSVAAGGSVACRTSSRATCSHAAPTSVVHARCGNEGRREGSSMAATAGLCPSIVAKVGKQGRPPTIERENGGMLTTTTRMRALWSDSFLSVRLGLKGFNFAVRQNVGPTSRISAIAPARPAGGGAEGRRQLGEPFFAGLLAPSLGPHTCSLSLRVSSLFPALFG